MKYFFGWFDPENIFPDNENKFRGDLTDVSAKKEALTLMSTYVQSNLKFT